MIEGWESGLLLLHPNPVSGGESQWQERKKKAGLNCFSLEQLLNPHSLEKLDGGWLCEFEEQWDHVTIRRFFSFLARQINSKHSQISIVKYTADDSLHKHFMNDAHWDLPCRSITFNLMVLWGLYKQTKVLQFVHVSLSRWRFSFDTNSCWLIVGLVWFVACINT